MAEGYPHCTCNNRGHKTQMKETDLQIWKDGTREGVKKFVCPACGREETVVNTHGDAITQAEMNSLEALT